MFGDHCSPISDTSVVSSMASASDHIDHVRTQMPYAFIGGAVAVSFYLPGFVTLPVKRGGLGIRSAAKLAPSAFLGSAAGCSTLVALIIPIHLKEVPIVARDEIKY